MYKIILFSLLVFVLLETKAQQTTEDSLDAISFIQFQNKDFKGLKETVKFAKTQQIDFYYLHLRAGILAFDNKNYEYAIPHFLDAIDFYPNDSISKEYLFYSYIYTARNDEAIKYTSNQNASFQQKIGFEKKKIDFIGFGGGIITTNNIEKNKNNSFFSQLDDKDQANRTLFKNITYGQLFFQNTLKNNLHIQNTFNLFQTNTLSQAIEINPEMKPPTESSATKMHYQYNLNINFSTKKMWNIASGFGYFKINSSNLYFLNDSLTQTVSIQQNNQSIHSFLGSFTFSKRIKNFIPYLQTSISNLNSSKQLQAEIGMTYYPLGNYNFYGTSAVALLKNDKLNNAIFTQKIGFKLTSWWWNDLNFQIGNLYNYNSNNGIVTYNTLDPIKLNFGFTSNFYIKKHLQLNLGYDFQKRTITISQQKLPENTYSLINSNYFTHSIKTTLLWNF